MDHDAPHRAPARGLALRILQSVVAVLAVGYLAQLLEWDQVREAMRRADPRWFASAYALQLPLVAAMVARWRVVLEALGHRVAALRLFRWYLWFFLFSCILPGTLGGDVVRGGACSRHTGAVHAATSILTERVCGMLSVLVLGGLGVAALSAEDRHIFGAEVAWAVRAVGVAAALGGALLLGVRGAMVRRLGPRILPLTARWAWSRRLWTALTEVLSLPTPALMMALATSAAAQLLDMIAMYALACALGLSVSLPVLIVLVPVTYVVTLLPISLGGLGIREGVTVYFLARAGVTPSDATLLALLVFSTKAGLGLLGGVLYLWRTAPAGHEEAQP